MPKLLLLLLLLHTSLCGLKTSALLDRHVEESFRHIVMSVARYLPQETSVWAINKVCPHLLNKNRF